MEELKSVFLANIAVTSIFSFSHDVLKSFLRVIESRDPVVKDEAY